MDFELMAESFTKLIAGVPVTLSLVGSSLVLGFVFAVVLAQMRLSKNLLLSKFAYAYVYNAKVQLVLDASYYIDRYDGLQERMDEMTQE